MSTELQRSLGTVLQSAVVSRAGKLAPHLTPITQVPWELCDAHCVLRIVVASRRSQGVILTRNGTRDQTTKRTWKPQTNTIIEFQ